MGCCDLDEDSFYEDCQRLLQKSEELRDGWMWETIQGTKEGYLKKTALRCVNIRPQQELRDKEEECNADIDIDLDSEEDTAVLTDSTRTWTGDRGGGGGGGDSGGHIVQLEYHVTFSSSYRTPVLFFRASSLGGRSLSLDEVWNLIRPKLRRPSEESLLSTITQQEHPLLGQSFFMLHPCKTEAFLRPVLQAAHKDNRSVNSVLTWLSVVAPLVSLDLPLDYCL